MLFQKLISCIVSALDALAAIAASAAFFVALSRARQDILLGEENPRRAVIDQHVAEHPLGGPPQRGRRCEARAGVDAHLHADGSIVSHMYTRSPQPDLSNTVLFSFNAVGLCRPSLLIIN